MPEDVHPPSAAPRADALLGGQERTQTRLKPALHPCQRQSSRLQATVTAKGPPHQLPTAATESKSRLEPSVAGVGVAAAGKVDGSGPRIGLPEDPIASPTQSPPFKLTLCHVIERSPGRDLQPPLAQSAHQAPQQQPKRQGQQQTRQALPMVPACVQAEGTPQRHVAQDQPASALPAEDRTLAPRLRHATAGGVADSVPPTPTEIFAISETPGLDRPAPRLLGVPGTALAHDASGRLLAGVFSPFSEFAAELREDEAADRHTVSRIYQARPLALGAAESPAIPQHLRLQENGPPSTLPRVRKPASQVLAATEPQSGVVPLLRRLQTEVVPPTEVPTAVNLPIPGSLPHEATAPVTPATSVPPAAVGEPASLRLQLPQPCLLAVASSDGCFVALVLGSHADREPSEVMVMEVGQLMRKNASPAATANAPEAAVSQRESTALRFLASVSVQRAAHAAGVPLTSSSLALITNRVGDPVLILSAIFELHDGPAPAGCPAINAIPCRTSFTKPLTGVNVASGALAVEHDDPLFAVAVLGPHQLLVAGDGGGGAILHFDPGWRSYTWDRRRLCPPPLAGSDSTMADVCALVGLDGGKGRGNRYLALSCDGTMGVWNLESRSAEAVVLGEEGALVDVVPLPGLDGSEDGPGQAVFLQLRGRDGAGDLHCGLYWLGEDGVLTKGSKPGSCWQASSDLSPSFSPKNQ